MRRKFLFGVIFLVIIGVFDSSHGFVFAEDLIVIGNRSVPASELTSQEIKKIFLGKKKVWGNGLKVEMAVLSDGQLTDRFLKTYVKKNSSMYGKYWKKQVFTGGAKPPVAFVREKDLVEYVSNTKGAVGYVSSQSYTDSVKILSVMH